MQNRLAWFVPVLLLTLAGCGQTSTDQPDPDVAVEGSDAPGSSLNSVKKNSPGSIAFIQCAACHAVTTDSAAKIGPSLANIFDQPAGQVAGYDYSEALAASKTIWNRPTLNRFLANPDAEISGTTMVFAGIEDEDERDAIIDYLETLSANTR